MNFRVLRNIAFLFVFVSGLAIVFGAAWTSGAGSPSLSERFELLPEEKKVPKAERSGEYSFDKAHSSIGFRIKHMGLIDVPGHFRKFEGGLEFDASKSRNSSVSFTADMKSIDTGINARDNHLRSKDFFEVKTYPAMKFESTRIKKKGKRYFVKGNLTMKDVTKEIEFPVRIYGPIRDQRGTIRMGVSGTTSINRREFNVNYGGNLPGGTAVLADNVFVDLRIEAVKKKDEKEKK
ncbi:MAG: YceI family protein [Pyrinomonadaceae bacterium]|nr:YceI family protein [Pyrinomonadaceae bacterium]